MYFFMKHTFKHIIHRTGIDQCLAHRFAALQVGILALQKSPVPKATSFRTLQTAWGTPVGRFEVDTFRKGET